MAAGSLPFPRSWRTLFGSENVGAIHGAVLTAWSAAAVAGPFIITELSNRAKAALQPGASKVHIYDKPLEVLAALLAVGFLLTLLVRPVRKPLLKEADLNAAAGRNSRPARAIFLVNGSKRIFAVRGDGRSRLRAAGSDATDRSNPPQGGGSHEPYTPLSVYRNGGPHNARPRRFLWPHQSRIMRHACERAAESQIKTEAAHLRPFTPGRRHHRSQRNLFLGG